MESTNLSEADRKLDRLESRHAAARRVRPRKAPPAVKLQGQTCLSESEEEEALERFAARSRLSKLSKMNLLALIELSTAALVLKLRGDSAEALRICNDALVTLQCMMKGPLGGSVVAQGLIEMLIETLLPTHLLATDDTLQGLSGIEEEEIVPQDEVMAASRSPTGNSAKGEPEPEGARKNGGSVRAILNSKEFSSILFITTFVPYIKPNTPQLKEQEVLLVKKREHEAAAAKGGAKSVQKTHARYSSKLFEFYAGYKERLMKEEREGVTLNPMYRRAIFHDEISKKKYQAITEEVLNSPY